MHSGRQSPTRTRSATADIAFACLLGVVLLLLSYVRLIGDLGSAAFNMQMVKTALSDPLWRTRLGLNIALFTLALLALHLAWGLLCWLLATLAGKAFPNVRCSRRQWTLLWWLLGLAWLLIANATYFPHASLGEPYQAMVRAPLAGATPLALATATALAAIATVILLALRRHGGRKAVWVLAGAAAVATASGFMWKSPGPAAAGTSAPNIVLLGIDSLRPDAVTPATTPHVHEFMETAAQLTDSVTPLARTFPSWVSILTGRHPHTTGAYMNLLPEGMIHTGTTLPQLLREHGYRTCYAIDETRFSNIDASYGFDYTATPRIGGSDFVLAWFADTPLSNLVVNTRLGALLFPHVHANRGAHVTYEPDSFVRRVDRQCPFGKPLFLAAHFTLPHWPYTWATSPQSEPNDTNIGAMYLDSVREADRQFGALLEVLRRRGVLDNAVVIVLSDHGEALGQPDDFIPGAFPEADDAANRAQKWGHGTSVFSPHQYRVVLGIRAYGSARSLVSRAGPVTEPVSLVDLAPTILDLLHIKSPEAFDGQSLASLLQTGVAPGGQFRERVRFTESEYNPQGFSLDNFSRSALATAAKVYRLDPRTDRITVRAELVDWIMSTRQYAALLEGAFAAAVPQDTGGGPYRFVFESSGHDGPQLQARLRAALEQRFRIQFSAETTDIRP